MSEEKAALEAEEAKKAEDAKKAEAAKVTTDPAELAKTIATLNSENAQRRLKEKELTERLAEIEANKAAEDEKAAIKNGEVQTLYDKLKADNEKTTGRLTATEEALNKILETEIALIPEQFHSLIPDVDPVKKMQWIANAKSTKLFDQHNGPGLRQPGEGEKNSLSRQAFESMSPQLRQKHIADGGKIHD